MVCSMVLHWQSTSQHLAYIPYASVPCYSDDTTSNSQTNTIHFQTFCLNLLFCQSWTKRNLQCSHASHSWHQSAMFLCSTSCYTCGIHVGILNKRLAHQACFQRLYVSHYDHWKVRLVVLGLTGTVQAYEVKAINIVVQQTIYSKWCSTRCIVLSGDSRRWLEPSFGRTLSDRAAVSRDYLSEMTDTVFLFRFVFSFIVCFVLFLFCSCFALACESSGRNCSSNCYYGLLLLDSAFAWEEGTGYSARL